MPNAEAMLDAEFKLLVKESNNLEKEYNELNWSIALLRAEQEHLRTLECQRLELLRSVDEKKARNAALEKERATMAAETDAMRAQALLALSNGAAEPLEKKRKIDTLDIKHENEHDGAKE
jgi:hypothetical protein